MLDLYELTEAYNLLLQAENEGEQRRLLFYLTEVAASLLEEV